MEVSCVGNCTYSVYAYIRLQVSFVRQCSYYVGNRTCKGSQILSQAQSDRQVPWRMRFELSACTLPCVTKCMFHSCMTVSLNLNSCMSRACSRIHAGLCIWIQIHAGLCIWIQIHAGLCIWIQIHARLCIWIQIHARLHIWIQNSSMTAYLNSQLRPTCWRACALTRSWK